VTFAMREAICALAEIEKILIAPEKQSHALETIRAVMLEKPGYWKDYYDSSQMELLLFDSYSDRIRYYWPDSKIEAALKILIANLTAHPPPDILLSRYLPSQYERLRAGELSRDPEILILDKIRDALRPYASANRI
jgi:D-tagatose-1,6-bisphosphate aldolase subunit GatZ/KbaZ